MMCINCVLPLPLPASVRVYFNLPSNSLGSIAEVKFYFNRLFKKNRSEVDIPRLEKAFGVGIYERIAFERAKNPSNGWWRSNFLSKTLEYEMSNYLTHINYVSFRSLTVIDKSKGSIEGFNYLLGTWVQLGTAVTVREFDHLSNLWDNPKDNQGKEEAKYGG